jgi:hypothetical protein
MAKEIKKEETKKEEIIETGKINKFKSIMKSTTAKVIGGVVVLAAVVAAGYFVANGDGGGIEVPAE